MITDFLFYYNKKCKHSTTKMTPREVLFYYKDKEIIEKVIINTEKSRKNFIQEIDYDVGDSVLITSWLLELPIKRIISFKREKPLKGIKEERKEIHSIKGTITKKGLYYCIVEVKEFRVPSKILKKNEKVKITYECIVKVK